MKICKSSLVLSLLLLIGTDLSGQASQVLLTSDSSTTVAYYSDTTQRARNAVQLRNLLFSGTVLNYSNGQKGVYLPPFANTVSVNTVEGVVVDFKPSYTGQLPDERFYYLRPSIRYGLGNKRLQAELLARYFYAPASLASVEISGGRYAKQLNEQSTLAQNIYTSYTLLSGDNYLKIYEKTYLAASHTFSPVKNFLLTGTLSWNDRSPLQNLPKYSDGEFTPNAPTNNEVDNTAFSRHQLTALSAKLTWQTNPKYTHERGRFIANGTSPKLSLIYTQSLTGLLGNDLEFSKIALRFSGQVQRGKYGAGKFEVEAGDFINDEHITFLDFSHFNGNRIIINNAQGLGSFQLLDYYSHSTRNAYLRAHYEHRWAGIKMMEEHELYQPVVSVNYLLTESNDPYLELGVGMDRILNKWRVDFYLSLQNLDVDRLGVRVGFAFD